MKTLEQIFTEIEKYGVTTKNKILISGATHLAQDEDGSVFGYKGEPEHMAHFPEWQSGDGEENRAVIYCGKLDEPENWKECVWQLP